MDSNSSIDAKNMDKMKSLVETDLLQSLGLENLPEEKQEEIMTQVMESVLNRVLVRIVDALGDDKKDEFMEMLEKSDDKQIRQYLVDNKVDMDKIVVEESLLYKNELLNKIGA